MVNGNGTNGNGDTVKINRNTLAIMVTITIAAVGFGFSTWKTHEDRLRSLEIAVAEIKESGRTSTYLLNKQSDKLDAMADDIADVKAKLGRHER